MKRAILFVVLLCLLVAMTDAKARSRKQRSKGDRSWKQRKRDCETSTCSNLVPDENMNCVNNCTSERCFAEVYGAEPLEDGEIDHERRRRFTSCLRNEAKEQKKMQSQERKRQRQDKKRQQKQRR